MIDYLDMLGANNLTEVFDYLFPLVAKKIGNDKVQEVINKQNSSGSTPLRTIMLIKIMRL